MKTVPKYHLIAADIAEKIVAGQYPIHTKLKGRSLLASIYQTSPETTRKALNLLVDAGVLSQKNRSGFIVLSKQKAKKYLESVSIHRQGIHLYNDIKTHITETREKLKELEKEIDNLKDFLLDTTD